MNIFQRQIVTAILLCLFIFIVLMVTFFQAFPINGWSLLWEQNVMGMPFIIVAPSLSIVGGIVYGFIHAWSNRFQLKVISDTLYQVEQGKPVNVDEVRNDQELDPIWNQVKKIQKQMMEQVKLSQKLATEKAEDQEKRIQEIVSQERNRLARELHDSVSQQLFAASMLMSAITESKSDSEDWEAKQLRIVEETIHQSQLEMRALLLHLRPVPLKGKSLQEGMKELLMELIQKVSMNITWKIEEEPLDKGVEEHLFRILQESVSNTLRHAKAKKLEVLLIKREQFVILRVVDDGVGFDVETSKSGSYGLQNMYERAIEIGGSMKIVSLKDKGTRLEVRVPLMEIEGEKND